MFRARLCYTKIADAVEILVFDRGFPAYARFIRFLGDNGFHDFLPRPGCQFGIGGVQIHPRQSQTDGRHAFGLIHGGDFFIRLNFLPRLETDGIARHVVKGIPHAP
jgi:hypothetical protein